MYFARFQLQLLKGYPMTENELFEKSERITKRIMQEIATNSRSQVRLEQSNEVTALTVAEAYAKFTFDYLRDCGEEYSNSVVLIVHGNVEGTLDISSAWFKKQAKRMKLKTVPFLIIVDGDVNINGDVLEERHKHSSLLVTGNVSCDYLLSGDGRIEIRGDLEATFGVCGQGNDGSLKVGGNLRTPYIVAGDHDMPREADCEWIYVEASDGSEEIGVGTSRGSGWGWDWNYFEDSNSLVSAEVWDDNPAFSVDAFFSIVRRGENPLIKQ
jgi:hypothetical protein